MPTSTVEDYVKAIHLLQQDSPSREATVVRLAATLGVTKGSVTAMVRKLRDARLAEAERYGGIRLTGKGRSLAVDMIRRHRLIEVFLVESLGLDWTEVHEEAHRLEHAMSGKVLDRLDEFLGHPTIDPHGDPIPDAAGNVIEADQTPLARLAKGDRGTVARIADQDPAFLEFAACHGLRPGTRISVVDVIPEAESISVKAARMQPVSLSFTAANKVHVEPVSR
ncbi:MAG: metal-dependent transcriptional regulator [Planctomycetota bacterium]